MTFRTFRRANGVLNRIRDFATQSRNTSSEPSESDSRSIASANGEEYLAKDAIRRLDSDSYSIASANGEERLADNASLTTAMYQDADALTGRLYDIYGHFDLISKTDDDRIHITEIGSFVNGLMKARTSSKQLAYIKPSTHKHLATLDRVAHVETCTFLDQVWTEGSRKRRSLECGVIAFITDMLCQSFRRHIDSELNAACRHHRQSNDGARPPMTEIACA